LGYLRESVTDGLMLLEFDRAPANAMDLSLLGELSARLDALALDPPRALVLAGRHGFFSGGVDLKAVPGYGPAEQRRMVEGINRMVLVGYDLPCPVVGAITGHAIAGGLVLALCADVRIASGSGRYGLTEVKVAVPYPAAAIGIVRAELSSVAARRLVLGSELTDAGECLALGVFDEVLPADAVVPRALDVAARLAAFPAEVYARSKRDLRAPALFAMREAVAADPLLEAWTDADGFA
jgi:enoyl-CoA hydratase/carnithine racemase